MPVPEPYCFFIDPLESCGLPNCVTGSLGAGTYGEYRLTADIDLVVLLRFEDIAKLRAAFPEKDYYVPPLDVLIGETRRGQRGMFNLIHQPTQFKADIFVAAQDPLHLWALANRRRKDMQGGETWIAPPEYVILRKLEYFREGGRDSIRGGALGTGELYPELRLGRYHAVRLDRLHENRRDHRRECRTRRTAFSDHRRQRGDCLRLSAHDLRCGFARAGNRPPKVG